MFAKRFVAISTLAFSLSNAACRPTIIKGTNDNKSGHAHTKRQNDMQFAGPGVIPPDLILPQVTMSVGTNQTQMSFAVNTASGTVWAPSDLYQPPLGAIPSPLNDTIAGRTGSGFLDVITLPGIGQVSGQVVGVDPGDPRFNKIGVVGIAPQTSNIGVLTDNPSIALTTLPDNAFLQSTNPTSTTEIVGLSIAPLNAKLLSRRSIPGNITFGSIDTTSTIRDIFFGEANVGSGGWNTPVNLTYGDDNVFVTPTPINAILGSFSPVIEFTGDLFDAYLNLTGAIPLPVGKYVYAVLAQEKVSSIQSLFFQVGGLPVELVANAQIMPTILSDDLVVVSSNNTVLSIVKQDRDSPNGFPTIILGTLFLERYLNVLDFTNNRVGFAYTDTTFSTDLNS